MATSDGSVTDTMVRLPRGGGRSLDAYLVRPDGGGALPGLIVIHELFGLNDNIRAITRRFAGAGYAALAVDLFSAGGRRALCMARLLGDVFVRPLQNTAVNDLRAAVDWLQQQPGVAPERIGVVGFCVGGSYALALACVERDLSAAAVFYGQNPRPLAAVARACPIVGSYGQDDALFRWFGRRLDGALGTYGVPHDIKIYPHAGHSFFNSGQPPEAAADAWERTIAFFAAHLNAPPASAQPDAAR